MKQILFSTLGRKFIMSISGIGLAVFAITHLAGNLLLLFPDGAVFNAYAQNLENFGILIEIAKIGILFLIFVHTGMAIWLKTTQRKARPENYKLVRSKGGPSKTSIGGRNMWLTGGVLFAFLTLHLLQFKWGPGKTNGYVTQLKGEDVRDLHRLVVETFHNPLWVGVYVFCMLVLGMHLRHGYWSWIQSLGTLYPSWAKPIFGLSFVLAWLVALGFLFIPVWIYFDVGHLFTA